MGTILTTEALCSLIPTQMGSLEKETTKLYIPHPAEKDCSIVGILERVAPFEFVEGRKIALILHGFHGHKDYLFQKRLAVELPMDSFRFDFRGNHETPGQARQGWFADDIVDVEVVVAYLKDKLKYKIDLIVGHSRGSVDAFHWLCHSELGRKCTGFVNVSGRYRMHKIYEDRRALQAEFDSKGYHEWTATVARKTFVARLYPEDLQKFEQWDTSIVWDLFPQNVHVLTIHGLADKLVPPYDALIYARALGNRSPGTHNLHLIEEADHNFTGMRQEVADSILEWWEVCQRGELKTGIWQTGVRGKL